MKHKLKLIFAIGTISLGMLSHVMAAPKADRVINSRSEYHELMNLWEPLTKKGIDHARHLLNAQYNVDDPAFVSHEQSVISTLRALADQGLDQAQYDLGMIYLLTAGVDQDHGRALAWLHKAADRNNSSAEYALGIMYRYGYGVPQDNAEALSWNRKAAVNEFGPALSDLAGLYALGQGVRRNLPHAYVWAELAAASNDPEACGDPIAKAALGPLANLMTPGEIEQAKRLMADWRSQHPLKVTATLRIPPHLPAPRQ